MTGTPPASPPTMTNIPRAYLAIPYRLQFLGNGVLAVKGTRGAHGDAGYTVEYALSPKHALVMLTDGGIGRDAWMPGTARVAAAIGVVMSFAALGGAA